MGARMIGFEAIGRTDISNRWVVVPAEISPAPMALAAAFIATALLFGEGLAESDFTIGCNRAPIQTKLSPPPDASTKV